MRAYKNAKSSDWNSLKNNGTGLPLQYAHLHNVIFLCTKFHQNPPKDLGGVENTRYFSKKMLNPREVTP
jgi:hypothetical protein